MTIFIDRAGDEDAVFGDLFTISGQDGGLGEDTVADPTVLQVSYVETAGQPATADRLNTLVNTDLGRPVIMTALPGGIDPYSGLDITGNGLTYLDTTTAGVSVVRVVYDDAQCNGAGIFTFDTGGNQITTPEPVILYHELSHALRAANGTSAPNDEIPAETDENVLRGELGLCQRDVNNHNGGCGAGDDCGGSGNGCFIASAAAGSAQSAEVVRLNQLRDRVVRATHLGARLMDAIYRDYYRFSPRIAAELRQDAAARDGVLRVAVRPLIAWYSLAEVLALGPDEAVEGATAAVFDACPVDVDANAIATAAQGIQEGESMSPRASPVLIYLASRAPEAARFRFASWAILDPLVRVWTSVAHGLDVAEQGRAWLAAAPLEALALPVDEALESELELLARGPLAQEARRREMGRRLVAAWPAARDMLTRHGFVDGGADGR